MCQQPTLIYVQLINVCIYMLTVQPCYSRVVSLFVYVDTVSNFCTHMTSGMYCFVISVNVIYSYKILLCL
jgi:hypothetical protein